MIKLSRTKFGNWPSGPSSKLAHPKLFMPGFMGGGGVGSGYEIANALRFRSGNSARLSRSGSAVTANRWAVSFWAKLGAATNTALFCGYSNGNNYTYLGTSTSNQLSFLNVSAGTPNVQLTTTAVFRDPSAWYHVALLVDTTLATAADRYQIWINGVRVTSFATNTNTLAQNSGTYWNDAFIQYIGTFDTVTNFYDGLIADFVNTGQVGTTPAVGAFGQTDPASGAWVPRRYTGTYGTNGFFLEFKDASAATASAIGKDTSGNGNNWTPAGISVTAGRTFDQMTDTPTNNAPTMNALDVQNIGTRSIVAAGLEVDTTASGSGGGRATFALPTSGKWYWEVTFASTGPTGNKGVGIGTANGNISGAVVPTECITYNANGNTTQAGSYVASGYATYNNTNTIGIAYDADANTVRFYRDNVAQGGSALSTSGMTAPLFPLSVNPSGVATIDIYNFGQRAFSYTPPTGFNALNTRNLPTPSIRRGDDAFFAGTRTGTGTADGQTQTITGVRFAPDLLWNKSRSNAFSHNIIDRVRGDHLILFSDASSAEANPGNQLALTSDGFVATQRAANAATNQNGVTYVNWAWREGAAYGFDIVTYTGTGAAGNNVAHNLNATPHFGIVKTRSAAGQAWAVRHRNLTAGHNLRLNTTDASGLASGFGSGGIADFSGSSTFTFTQGSSDWLNVNGSGATYVAYLWTEIPGFSRFGWYTGNGSLDGPFLWCGFKPRLVWIKRVDSTGDWHIRDTAREPFNTSALDLFANASTAETASNYQDHLSNGFKIRNLGADWNASGGTYIFAAWAETPFKYANAR